MNIQIVNRHFIHITPEILEKVAFVLIKATFRLHCMRKSRFSSLCILANVGMSVVYAIFWGLDVFVPYRYKIVFGFAYYVVIFIECIYLFGVESGKRGIVVFLWLSAYSIVLPLTVTNFTNGRVLLAPYVLVSIFTLILVLEVLKKVPARRVITICTVAAVLFLGVRYTQIYTSLGATNPVCDVFKEKLDLSKLNSQNQIYYKQICSNDANGLWRDYKRQVRRDKQKKTIKRFRRMIKKILKG